MIVPLGSHFPSSNETIKFYLSTKNENDQVDYFAAKEVTLALGFVFGRLARGIGKNTEFRREHGFKSHLSWNHGRKSFATFTSPEKLSIRYKKTLLVFTKFMGCNLSYTWCVGNRQSVDSDCTWWSRETPEHSYLEDKILEWNTSELSGEWDCYIQLAMSYSTK